MWLLLVSILISLPTSAARTLPRDCIEQILPHINASICVKKGDLFSADRHLVVGFTDTFDTDVSDSVLIASSSVQAQFQQYFYGDRIGDLNADLELALQHQVIESLENPSDKTRGKLKRYPIGSVATLTFLDRNVFCTAYGRMSNNYLVQSSVDFLWASLGSLWEEVRQRGRLEPVAMPVIGAEMARVTSLSRESLLKLILLSFVANSRQQLITRSLTVFVHPKDFSDFDLLEIRSFLRKL
ncbi:macro domain-containing protein [Streptomyces parvulus]|uniref:macro domain-containing protein n=1 Tax=Streptomyces parvulus TaxID=146923 RepID=UPI0036BDEABA